MAREEFIDEEHVPEEGVELEEAGYEAPPLEFYVYVNNLALGRIPNGKLALGIFLAAQLRHSTLARRFPQLRALYEDAIALTKSLSGRPQRSLIEALTEKYWQPVYVPLQPQYYQPAQRERRAGLLERLRGFFLG
jgi:hypothetical protein